jgi:hypothetical protein
MDRRIFLQVAAGTSTKLWSEIDIDIPTEAGHSKSTPEGTKAVVLAGV